MPLTDRRTLARAVARLAERDATLFADEGIAADRLGWIGLPEIAARSAAGLAAFARGEAGRGITDVVLLGMGGSSLAPLVLSRVMGSAEGRPALHVLDTTDPAEVGGLLARLEPSTTLVVVSSKSGTTIEPLVLAGVFREAFADALGDETGAHFVAITDPGSPLEAFAEDHGFAHVFHAPADVGGRYAALSTFATVPAALIGVDVAELAAYAVAAERSCLRPGDQNPAQALAGWISDAFADGRDKLTVVCSQSLAPFGLWVEQLIAESTGKAGTGILPVLEAAPGLPAAHGADRLTFVLRTPDDEELAALPDLLPDGEPVFESVVDDPYALGAQFVLWEWAIPLACAMHGIEPFDQPDVEEAKATARRIVHDDSPSCARELVEGGIAITSSVEAAPASLRASLEALLAEARPGSYLAVLAYLPEDEALLAPLRSAVDRIATARHIAVTFELGPRYLHSTGQYHKGGPNTGLFLVVTARDTTDIAVPGVSFGLARLHRAQSAADVATLAAHDRAVVSVELPAAAAEHLAALAGALDSLS